MRHKKYKSIIELSFSQHSASSGYIKQQFYKINPIFIHMDKTPVVSLQLDGTIVNYNYGMSVTMLTRIGILENKCV